MSLINETLKSIQKKNMKSAQIIPIPIVLLQSRRYKILLYKIFLFVFIVILSMLIAALCYRAFMLPHDIANNNHIVTHDISQKTSLILQKDPYENPVKIKGVSINVKDNITEIIVSLSQEAFYYLSTDLLSNKLNIHFDNAEFVATLPDFSALNAAVSDVELKNQGNRAFLSITMLPKSTIQYLQLNTEKNHSELIINIDNHSKNILSDNVNTPLSAQPVKVIHIDTIHQRYANIMQQMEKNDLKTTLEKLKDILTDEPSYREARVSYAALLIEDHQYEEAQSVLNRGLSMHENYIPYIELQARIYMLKNRSDLALELMSDYAPPMVNHQRYYEQMAFLYQHTNQHKAAINLYKNLLSIDATHFEWWLGLGTSLEKTMALDDAELAYKRALILNTSDASMNKYLRDRLLALGERHASKN